MSNIKISSNLFLGRPELLKMQAFYQEEGYVRGLLNDSVNFGLIKNGSDPAFSNAYVSSDSDININGTIFKTIKINQISGFDKNGNFLVSEAITQVPIPGSPTNVGGNQWFWIRISHRYSNEEKGLWNLSTDGTLTSTAGELTKVLRGQPNFPSRVRFTKDTQKYGNLLNTADYDILEVVDDNNCILNGVAFQQENNLKLNVVGTFTYGAPVAPSDKMIFNHDSVFLELIAEESNNSTPTAGFELGRTFYLARVKVEGNSLLIQDKREDFWETKGSSALTTIETSNNPLLGIESIKFDHPYTTRNYNLIEVAWTFRSSSWSVNSETNTLTLSAGQGGAFKTINDFVDGDFDGWRVYTEDGSYSIIINSVRQGNAIDLQLDSLNLNSYSPDGGSSFYDSTIVVAPNAEAIEIILTPDPNAEVSTQTFRYEFEINQEIGKCSVLAYNDPYAYYQLSYRYRNNFIYSPEIIVTEGEYYDESSFNEKGNILPPGQTHIYSYNGGVADYLVRVMISPNAYKNFNTKVDKGDRVGVEIYNNLSSTSTIDLIVGQSYNTLVFTGNLALNSDLLIILDSTVTRITNGNVFVIQFNATALNLNGYAINIATGSNILQTLTAADIYMMKNTTNGIVITATCDGSSWILRQNYDLGIPGELKKVVGVGSTSPVSYFDADGWGKVQGLYGYHLADGRHNTINAKGRFLVGYSADNSSYAFGQTGGAENVTLTESQLPAHNHNIIAYNDVGSEAGQLTSGNDVIARRFRDGSFSENYELRKGSADPTLARTSNKGSNNAHENRPPYYAVVFAQKMF